MCRMSSLILLLPYYIIKNNIKLDVTRIRSGLSVGEVYLPSY